MDRDLDSLGILYGVCLKWFQAKRTRQCEDGLSSAGLALFWAEMECLCIWVFESLWNRVIGLV